MNFEKFGIKTDSFKNFLSAVSASNKIRWMTVSMILDLSYELRCLLSANLALVEWLIGSYSTVF